MKVLFVIDTLDYADQIAIAYLGAVAKQHHHETKFCTLASGNFLRFVLDWGPDVIAYSVNVMSYNNIVRMNAMARLVRNFIAIMGGPQPTYSPETFIQSGMDAYCVGEGEGAFGEFLDKISVGEQYDDILNIITKKAKNPVRPLIRDLDSLPLADRDLTIANSYLANTPKKTFYATRGCPFDCAYCCNNYYHKLYHGEPLVRRFSVQRLIEEIERVKSKYRMEFVKFGDDLFAMKADSWLRSFAQEYRKRVNIPFNCYLRLDLVNIDLLSTLKDAGCYSVHLSVDSTSKHVRDDVLRRRMQTDRIEDKLRLIHEFKINTWVNFMLAAPESTLTDDIESIRLSKRVGITYPAYSTTTPMPGTDLYDYCIRANLIDTKTYTADMTGCSRPSALTCFSEKERQIRYNIYLLGAAIAKLPWPVSELAIKIIKHVSPNGLFVKISVKIRVWLYNHYITKKIFKFSKNY